MDSSHKGPVTRKMFPFDDIIMMGRVTRYQVTLNAPLLNVIYMNFMTQSPKGALPFPRMTLIYFIRSIIFFMKCFIVLIKYVINFLRCFTVDLISRVYVQSSLMG